MSEMIDAVAKAIEEAMFAPHELPLNEELHRKYLDTAREAIAAMREPTSEMMRAGGDAMLRTTRPLNNALDSWNAMIDEALR